MVTGRKEEKEIKCCQRLDARGLLCPLPVIRAQRALAAVVPGEAIEVRVTDPGAPADFRALAESRGHELLVMEEETEPWLAGTFDAVDSPVTPASSRVEISTGTAGAMPDQAAPNQTGTNHAQFHVVYRVVIRRGQGPA